MTCSFELACAVSAAEHPYHAGCGAAASNCCDPRGGHGRRLRAAVRAEGHQVRAQQRDATPTCATRCVRTGLCNVLSLAPFNKKQGCLQALLAAAYSAAAVSVAAVHHAPDARVWLVYETLCVCALQGCVWRRCQHHQGPGRRLHPDCKRRCNICAAAAGAAQAAERPAASARPAAAAAGPCQHACWQACWHAHLHKGHFQVRGCVTGQCWVAVNTSVLCAGCSV